MFYEILVMAAALGCYLLGAKYIDRHMITFFPEVGQDAITGEEEARLRKELSHLRLVKPKREIKKAA